MRRRAIGGWAIGTVRPRAVALVGALCLLVAMAVSRREAEAPLAGESPAVRTVSDEAKATIARFWETFREAGAARDAGKPEEALALFEKTLALDPSHEQSLYDSANLLLGLHRYPEALERYERLFRVHPDKSNRALLQMATVLSCLEPGAPLDLARAMALARQAATRNREETGPFLAMARIALTSGDLAAARENLRIVLNLDPKALAAHRLAAIVALHEGAFDEALAHAHRGIEAFKKDRPIDGVLSEGDIGPGGRAPAADLDVAGLLLVERLLARRDAGAVSWRPVDPLDALAPRPGICAIPLRKGEPATLIVPGAEGRLHGFHFHGGHFAACALPTGIDDGTRAGTVVAVDAGGQGGPDLLVLGGDWTRAGKDRLLRRRADGSYADITAGSGLPASDRAVKALVGDLDGDGRQDLVLIGIGCPGEGIPPVRVLLGDGRGHYVQGPAVAFPAGATVADGVLADLDGDGRPAVVLATWTGGLKLLANAGGGRLVDATARWGLDTPLFATCVTVTDLDGSGSPSIVCGQLARPEDVLARQLDRHRHGALTPAVFRRRSRGRPFERVVDAGLENACAATGVAALDLDGDGTMELVFAAGALSCEDLEPPVALARGRDGHYVDVSRRLGAPVPMKAWAAVVADVDGDGIPDLVLPGGGLAAGDRWRGTVILGHGPRVGTGQGTGGRR